MVYVKIQRETYSDDFSVSITVYVGFLNAKIVVVISSRRLSLL